MNQFKHSIVRDLAWVIASPPLVSGNFKNTHWWNHEDCLSEYDICLPRLLALDKDPTPLIEHFGKLTSNRLGLRFEHYIAYWLNISPNYELITQNLQIIEPLKHPHKKGNQTHGELDFIIRDTRTNKTIHLEVAVKFYLGIAPYKDQFRWFGTNTKDQLGKKVEHLKQHQTQLANHFSKYLNERGYRIDEKHCILKGRLFYPMESDIAPDGVTKNHLRGRWVQSPENILNNGNLYPLEKTEWLAKLEISELKADKLKTEFSKDEKARCYVQLNDKKEEINRIFNLPEHFIFPD